MTDMWMITFHRPDYNDHQTVVSRTSPFEYMIGLNRVYYIDSEGMEFSKEDDIHIVHSYKLSEEDIEKYNELYEKSKEE